ncbi:hypothetical protein C8F01DRAFT_1099288 [Mycena amicta]|nr:hypothetical protein C8F01DRAFT_1099288 [Mycena amicta]
MAPNRPILDEYVGLSGARKIDSPIPNTLESHLHRLRRDRWGRPLDPGPFCEMKIGIEAFKDTDGKVVIFEQYSKVLALVERLCADGSTKGLLLTGSPGIGKTSCLWYLLVESLSKSQPVVLYYSNEVYAFTSTALYKLSDDSLEIFTSSLLQNLLVLVNLDDTAADRRSKLLCQESCAFIVAASYPNRPRYKHWVKQSHIPTYVLDAPERADYLNLAKLKNISLKSFPHRMRLLLNVYGPNLLSIVPLFSKENDEVDEHIQSQIADVKLHLLQLVNTDLLQTLFQSPERIVSKTTHTLAVAYGVPSGQLNSQDVCHRIRSPLILRLLLQMASSAKIPKLRQMYSILSSSSPLSVSRGWTFEVLAHELISVKTEIELHPVSKQNGYLRKDKSGHSISVPIGSRSIEIYTSGRRFDSTISTDTYYIPAEGNNPTFDAFIPGEENLALQMSVGRRHGFAEEGADMVRKRLQAFDEDRDWEANPMKFVFVVPKGPSFEVKAPKRDLKDLTFWILELDIDDSQYRYFETESFAKDVFEEEEDNNNGMEDVEKT